MNINTYFLLNFKNKHQYLPVSIYVLLQFYGIVRKKSILSLASEAIYCWAPNITK